MQRLDKEFISWVPCVSGELFLSKTDFGLGSYDFYISNVSVQSADAEFRNRYLYASSVVDWQDTDVLSDHNRGLYRVVIVAKSDDYRTLHGSVYLLEKNTKDQKNLSYLEKLSPRSNCLYEQKVLEGLHRLRGHFPTSCSIVEDGDDCRFLKATAMQINTALDTIDSTVVHKVDFNIHRTGIMLSSVAYSKAHGLPLQRNHKERRRLCGQAFYYLKFLLHKHTHHSNDNETLTTVHGLKNKSYDNAQVLVRDLKRGMVDAKRARRYTGYSASGIAAYGATLVRVCDSMGWYEPGATLQSRDYSALCSVSDSDGEVEYMRNVGSSLELLDKEQINSKVKSASSRFASLYTSSVLWLFTVFGPFLVYINIFSNGYFSAKIINGEDVERVKMDGDIVDQFSAWQTSCESAWYGLQGSCSLLTQILVDYSAGVVSSNIKVMVLILLLSFASATLFVSWGRYSLFEGVGVWFRRYVSRRAYSLKSGRTWQYRLAVILMLVNRLSVVLYQPKSKEGVKGLWIALTLASLTAVGAVLLGLRLIVQALF